MKGWGGLPPPPLFGLRWMGRGDIRLIILETLRSGPKRGYEVIKSIREMFGGWYTPSPGAVYPTLQWLEDEGLVESETTGDGKRRYRITEEGLKFLREREEQLTAFREKCRRATSIEGLELLDSARRLGITVIQAYIHYPTERLAEVSRILEEARKRILSLGEGGER
ncbi:MAG: PadR family transcriptional regulator [Nitrososphaerota archaeon]|nr:PadR family transcriptional regulator [Candidatus Calditenuaceae archaeon]MDW8073375.1 PadR family transcriptional regulator [Nitrososphaerota archaeon]